MGRAPCCDKMGVKKGPWTAQEDQILVDFIQRNGLGNWRALPKQAGLLRCGKSCRLRWINYLRPDIKRGNFSDEEEAAIIKLHELLGNRWSAIASRLPGRTDNEIKNVWNTHLKKRLLRMGIDPGTRAVPTMAGHNQISLDHDSECSETSPSMKKDMFVSNSAVTQPKVLVDCPPTDLSYSNDLSSEIFSSTDNEAINSDSSLDCIQFDYIDSFDVEIGYQQYPTTREDNTESQDLLLDETFILGNQNFEDEEKSLPIQSSEDQCFMPTYSENTNPHQLWNGPFQANDDDCYSTDYWFNFLRQSEPSPTLYEVSPLSQA